MKEQNPWLVTIGLILFLQLGGMFIANVFSLLDRWYGIKWLYPVGVRPRVNWSLPFFFLAWMILIAFQQIFLYTALELIPHFKEIQNQGVFMMLSVVLANLGFFLVYLFLAGPGVIKGMNRLGLSGPDFSGQTIMGLRASLLVAPWVYAVNVCANLVFQNNDHAVKKMLDEGLSSETVVLAAISAVIMAPLAEEVLFRGILLGALIRKTQIIEAGRRRLPVQLANFVTSLFFAMLHADAWPAPIGIFFLSLMLGKIYITTGRLWPCIAAHAMFNSTGILGMILAVLIKKSGGAINQSAYISFWIY